MKIFATLPLVIALAGCAVDQPAPPPSDAGMAMMCNAAPAQRHIGHKATSAVGAEIQRDAGAATLRWGPPGAMWTMDMRGDRVNVRYDEAMTITAITCG